MTVDRIGIMVDRIACIWYYISRKYDMYHKHEGAYNKVWKKPPLDENPVTYKFFFFILNFFFGASLSNQNHCILQVTCFAQIAFVSIRPLLNVVVQILVTMFLFFKFSPPFFSSFLSFCPLKLQITCCQNYTPSSVSYYVPLRLLQAH